MLRDAAGLPVAKERLGFPPLCFALAAAWGSWTSSKDPQRGFALLFASGPSPAAEVG